MEDKLYAEANSYRPKPGKNYSWVWDYSQFRFNWAFEKTRYVEEKAQKLLTLIITVMGGLWVGLTYLLQKPIALHRFGKGAIAFGVLLLIVSAYSSIQVSRPNEHLYPMRELKALKCADTYESEEMAQAKFCLALSESTDLERKVTKRKSDELVKGTGYLCGAVVAFIAAIFWELACR